MTASRKPAASATNAVAGRALAQLLRTPRIGDYGIDAAKTVMALRLVALCSKSGHDPMVELTRRLGDVGAAKAMLGFLDRCSASWPEAISVNRPCCAALSPDESAIAAVAQAAAKGDHRAFDAVLDGFIRPDRRAGLFVEAMAAMEALGQP